MSLLNERTRVGDSLEVSLDGNDHREEWTLRLDVLGWELADPGRFVRVI